MADYTNRTFDEIDEDKVRYLETLTDTFIPGRVAELRASNRKEIAATLGKSVPTVKKQVHSALEKLSLTSRAKLIALLHG